jgi:hypothetical protein
VPGDVKLTNLLQKFVPYQPGSEESYRSFNAFLLVRDAFVQRWGFAYKSRHILAPSSGWAGALPNSQSPM